MEQFLFPDVFHLQEVMEVAMAVVPEVAPLRGQGLDNESRPFMGLKSFSRFILAIS